MAVLVFLSAGAVGMAAYGFWRVGWRIDHYSSVENKILELLINIFYILLGIFILLLTILQKFGEIF
jgi:uncharacterized membrane protein